MKEIMGVDHNIILLLADKKLEPLVELIFVCIEPQHLCDAGGMMVRRRESEDVRLHAHPKSLREMAKRFLELADEAEAAIQAAIDATEPEPPGHGG